ncbi:MAG TPA: GAF domain-containing protein, partial [Anaerolineae bacterium]|nr:GAF domain-containing protein [Anaerolineae bacterium]
EVGGLTEDDLILLEGLGAQIAVAIENARLFQEEQRRYQIANTLQEVARILSSTLDLKGVPDMILEQLGRVVDYDSAAIFLLSDGLLKVVAGRGFPDMERIMGITMSVEGNALFRQICREKRPLVLADAQKDERFLGAGGTGYVRGWIGAPLIAKGEVIGSLTIDSREPGVYDEDTAQIVFLFASQAALALENARLFEEARRRERQARALYEAGQLAARLEGGLEAGLQTFFERLTEVGDFDRWWVPVLGGDGLDMEGLAGRWEDVSDEQMKRRVVLADEPGNPVVIAMQNRETVIINDPEHDERLADLPEEIRRAAGKYVTVPVISGERVIGALSIGRPVTGRDISAGDVDLAHTLAGQVALAIENARLFAQTQEQVRKLQAAIEAQERLTRTVRELSSPVVQVWENVLALPLVGGIDATRAKQITEELLTGIVKHQAEMVIVDITGVPVVDTQVANYILQTIKAASLLGAHCVLVGISAEVAQAMISLGVNLSAVTTLSNLQAGIQYALEKMGLGVAPLPPADAEEAFPGDLELARGASVKG